MDGSTTKRILIIEDNVDYLKMLKMRLEFNGYKTISVSDGLEGLNVARKEQPDLILLDLMLPGMGGHKVCRMLKFDGSVKHIPIVMLTSRDLEKDRELAKQGGADAFIVKTTKAEVILDVIDRLLVGLSAPNKVENSGSG